MQLFINNWSAVLTAPATASAVSLSVPLADAAKLTGLGGGDHYLLTLAELDGNGVETAWEAIKVTDSALGALTVLRGQEGTTARDWAAAAVISARVTKGTLEALRDTPGPAGVAGQGVPAGGAAGQVLAKVSGDDYNTAWVDPSAGGGAVGEWAGVDAANFHAAAEIGDLGPRYNRIISAAGIGSYLNIDASRAFGLNRRADVTLGAADDGLVNFSGTAGIAAQMSAAIQRAGHLQIDIPAGGDGSYGVGLAGESGNRFAPNVFSVTTWFQAIGRLWSGGITAGRCNWILRFNKNERMELAVTLNTAIGSTYRVSYFNAASAYITVDSGITPDPIYSDEIDFQIWRNSGTGIWILGLYIGGATALEIPLTGTRFWAELVDPSLALWQRELRNIAVFISAFNTGVVAQSVAWTGAKISLHLQ